MMPNHDATSRASPRLRNFKGLPALVTLDGSQYVTSPKQN